MTEDIDAVANKSKYSDVGWKLAITGQGIYPEGR